MKNRRIGIIAFVLVAVLLMGVGYAALSDQLDITGAIAMNNEVIKDDFDADVHFVTTHTPTMTITRGESSVDIDATKTSASYVANDNDKASFSAKQFQELGETVTVTYQIINEGTNANHDALVSVAVEGAMAENFEITATIGGQAMTIGDTSSTYELAVNQTAEVVVTLKCTTLTGTEGNITFYLNATEKTTTDAAAAQE